MSGLINSTSSCASTGNAEVENQLSFARTDRTVSIEVILNLTKTLKYSRPDFSSTAAEGTKKKNHHSRTFTRPKLTLHEAHQPSQLATLQRKDSSDNIPVTGLTATQTYRYFGRLYELPGFKSVCEPSSCPSYRQARDLPRKEWNEALELATRRTNEL